MNVLQALNSDSEPIIASANEQVSDPRAVDFLAKLIFPDDLFAPLRTDVSRAVSSQLPLSFYDIESRFEALVQDRKDDPLKALAQMHIYRQRARSAAATDAYEVKGKENWQAVYWPDPSAPAPHGRPLFGELPFARRSKFIKSTTPIGSAGSCFAMEIRKFLAKKKYNYVVTEPNDGASANWGPQYNAVAFQQTVEWAFGLRERPNLVWEERSETGARLFFDPFREGVVYSSTDEVASALQAHRQAARKAFEQVEVFILTIGLNEVRWLGSSDVVLARFPRRFAPQLARQEVLSIEQNASALQRMLDVWRSYNEKIKLIVTVSPIPLYATFQGHQTHVIVATQHEKSVLRLALDQFAARNPEQVTYFPAYETVMWCTRTPWQLDARHVTDEAVENVMRLFDEVFLLE